jgi:hypothetical protein
LSLTSAPNKLLKVLHRRRGKPVVFALEQQEVTFEGIRGIGCGDDYIPEFSRYVTNQAYFYGYMLGNVKVGPRFVFLGELVFEPLPELVKESVRPRLDVVYWRLFRIWWELWLDRQESGCLGAEYV